MPLTPNDVPHRALTDESKIDFGDLQGNILIGHGRDHTAHIFVRFGGDPAATRAWLATLVNPTPGPLDVAVTSAARQAAQTVAFKANGGSGDLFVNLFLAAGAYAALGAAPPADPNFVAGMGASRGALKDPPRAAWECGYQGDIHAMVLLAHDHPGHLAAAEAAVVEAVASVAKGVVAHVERGAALRNVNGDPVEHFGYVDGRSQPVFLEAEMVKERDGTDGITVWDPCEDAFEVVLVPDPTAAAPKSLGSYFVFRKLEQNVRGFKTMETTLAHALRLAGEDAERAGAMVVGRFEDGTPVVLQNEAGTTHPVPNNFNYANDPAGTKCPLQGHIRKVNPRGDLTRRQGVFTGGDEQNLERVHRIARRGITYGDRAADLSDRPGGGVGLLFMCFQQEIARQFEFMQAAWANNDQFPEPLGSTPPSGPLTGIDPVIGQALPGDPTVAQNWSAGWGDTVTTPCDFASFVRLKGGEYFFAPSLAGVAAL